MGHILLKLNDLLPYLWLCLFHCLKSCNSSSLWHASWSALFVLLPILIWMFGHAFAYLLELFEFCIVFTQLAVGWALSRSVLLAAVVTFSQGLGSFSSACLIVGVLCTSHHIKFFCLLWWLAWFSVIFEPPIFMPPVHIPPAHLSPWWCTWLLWASWLSQMSLVCHVCH